MSNLHHDVKVHTGPSCLSTTYYMGVRSRCALRAVGQTIIKLGCPDPRMASPHSGKLHPLLRDCLAAIGKEDDPQDRSPPANVTILRAVAEAPDKSESIHEQNPKTNLRSETKNTTITQKPVESLLGLSEPKHLGIEKIEI